MISKIVMVTDQPFWRRENGAHQRIWSLVKFLLDGNSKLTIFYMIARTDEDRTTCNQLDCEFVEYDPQGSAIPDLISPMVKVAKSLFSAGKQSDKTESRPDKISNSENSSLSESTVATLETYRWPHAVTQFRHLIDQVQPELVIFEYVTWGNLLDDFPKPNRSFLAAVDTHDALHIRNQQFKNNGQQHWIDISRDEEAAELQKFDLILSIQDQEAKLFSQMAPSSDVIVVGHVPDISDQAVTQSKTTDNRSRVELGFLGSKNHANLDGIRWFLQNCWPQIIAKLDGVTSVQLNVGGPVRDSLNDLSKEQLAHVNFVGHVASVDRFYQPLDILINPVRFGSGLKIKTVESYCYGKPLVVHSHSAGGLSASATKRVLVCENAEQFVDSCLRLIRNPQFRNQIAERARLVGENEFAPSIVYSPIMDWLRKKA